MNIQERFEHLNFIQEAVFVLNSLREIVFANDAAAGHFGESRTGRDIVQLIRNPQCLELIGDVLQGSESAKASIQFGAPTNGLFNVQVSRFSGDEDVDILLLVSLRDVNEVRQAERMRSDFVANVSHELRSPLSTISGFIETLKGSAKDDPKAQARFLDLMEQEADRMKRLITDLLSLSKVEADHRRTPVGQVDLVSIVEGVRTSLIKLAKLEGKTIDLKLPMTPLVIPGHEDELIQVAQNLLENALKYSAPETTVTVRVEEKTTAAGFSRPVVKLEVVDEGRGIARHHLSRLTERFYRVDDHRSRDDGGTGLGLAIVKHIVQHHRGQLKIDSEIGQGSTFTVLLPRT